MWMLSPPCQILLLLLCLVERLSGADLYLWGRDTYGALGDGSNADRDTPAMLTVPNVTFTAVSCGNLHTAALTSVGDLYIWGHNQYGQLGNGTTTDRNVPAPLVMSGVVFKMVVCGGRHSGAVTSGGTLFLWGDNTNGQIGDGTTIQRNSPTLVNVGGKVVQMISFGWQHSSALTTDGSLYLWGLALNGRIGDGSTSGQQTSPLAVTVPGKTFRSLILGGIHSAAITTAGELYMWGGNRYGQIGNGGIVDQPTPLLINVNGTIVTMVSLGFRHTMALIAGGSLYCWGANDFGQIGDGTTNLRNLPTFIYVSASPVTFIATSYLHSSAITSDGNLFMWGANDYGQLGDDTTTSQSLPEPIYLTGKIFLLVDAGGFHTAALAMVPLPSPSTSPSTSASTSLSPSPAASASPSPSPVVSPSPTPSPSISTLASQSTSHSASPIASQSSSPGPTPSPPRSILASQSASPVVSTSQSLSPAAPPNNSPGPSSSLSPSPSTPPSSSPTSSRSISPSTSGSSQPSPNPSLSPSPSPRPSRSVIPTASSAANSQVSPSPRPSSVKTPTQTATSISTLTKEETITPSPTATATQIAPTPVPVNNATPSSSPIPSQSESPGAAIASTSPSVSSSPSPSPYSPVPSPNKSALPSPSVSPLPASPSPYATSKAGMCPALLPLADPSMIDVSKVPLQQRQALIATVNRTVHCMVTEGTLSFIVIDDDNPFVLYAPDDDVRLIVRNWGNAAFAVVRMFPAVPASLDTLQITSGALSFLRDLRFIVSFDRLSANGSLVNDNNPLEFEAVLPHLLSSAMIFQVGNQSGASLESEGGSVKALGDEIYLIKMPHTSVLVAYGPGSVSLLLALLALIAIPLICCIVVCILLCRRRRKKKRQVADHRFQGPDDQVALQPQPPPQAPKQPDRSEQYAQSSTEPPQAVPMRSAPPPVPPLSSVTSPVSSDPSPAAGENLAPSGAEPNPKE